MLPDFVIFQRVVCYAFLPRGQITLSSPPPTPPLLLHTYLTVSMGKYVAERLEKRNLTNWFLYHDNTPAHSAPSVREFLANNIITVTPLPPYVPHLAPYAFFLFSELKMALIGRRFNDTAVIQAKSWDSCQVSKKYFKLWRDP
jgi:hypothetical protein